MTARDYFMSHRPETKDERAMYSRIITSLARRNLTMQTLCGMSERDLTKLRGVGEVSRVIIKAECNKYLNENDGEYRNEHL